MTVRTAAYARYSSDLQRDASLEDQLRNCRAYCARHGWPDPVVYTDAAISGSRNDRPGYRQLLADATRYDVVLIDDLSRLSRDSVESQSAVKRLKFHGVRVIGVSDGIDSGRRSHKADVGLRGLMSELYLDDLAEKTHRGLTGRVLAGSSAGGLPYGYRVTTVGQLAIDDGQAAVVRRIFAAYVAGDSPRTIAHQLNDDGVPSPRGSTWAMTAIYGDVRRGIGILANPIYAGERIWNRSHWIKHPDSGRRVRQERPESDWKRSAVPELAIVDAATWEAAQRRLKRLRRKVQADGAPVRAGRPARHLLSGILRCGQCGGRLVVVDAYNYGCSAAKDRGTCRGGIRVNRKDAEAALLRTLQGELLSEAAFQQFQRAATAALREAGPDTGTLARQLADAQRTRGNILAAIRAGILTPSTKAELEAAEADVDEAERAIAEARAWQPSSFLPRARETWDRLVRDLGAVGRGTPQARDAVIELIGDQVPVSRKENGDLVAEIAASSGSQIALVAGAGFEPATFGL